MLTRLKAWCQGNRIIGSLSYDHRTGETTSREAAFRCEPYFRWFDLWIGIYIDMKNRHVYVGYLPCCGFKIGWF